MPSQFNLILTYILLVFIWSTTPLAIVWSVSDLHMMWSLVLRFFFALPLALMIIWGCQIAFPFHSTALKSYLAGSLSLIGSQIFTYAATAYLSSGMIALMFGLAPIIAGLVGRFAFGQVLRTMQWVGMVISLSGLSIICFSDGSQHVQPIGIGLMLLSVFAYVYSVFWVKKIRADISPMAQASGSILVSTVLALCLVPFIWQYAPSQIPDLKSTMALFYTVMISSLLAMFCYFKLVQNIQAATLSLTTVMTPLFAILIGAVLNHEHLSIDILSGSIAILFGLFIYFYRDIQTSWRMQKQSNV